MKFSLLISEYIGGNSEYLNRALKSIWDDQILKPDQIVFVKDGSLTNDLNFVIDKWKLKLGNVLSVIELQNNVGLGEALNIGLSNCKYDLIARMDSDDISLPERFRNQIDFFYNNPDIDILGSYISEFDNHEGVETSVRFVPITHQEIIKFARIRNPFNHPSVMYKKNSVLRAGGPKNFTGFDDYYLWARMIIDGSKCANIPKILLKMRAGYGQLERRSGFKYAMSEIKLQKKFLNIGFINYFEFIQNVTIRFIARIVPKSLVKAIYKKLRG